MLPAGWPSPQDIVAKDRHGFDEFEIPSRDIGFNGCPYKEMVLIEPCTSCLVSLTDKPVRSLHGGTCW